MPLWECISLVLCMTVGTGFVIYAFSVWQPLPLLIGSILVAFPITVAINFIMKKISDIRFEKQFGRKN